MYNFLHGVLYVRCLALCPIIFCYSTRNRSHLLFQHTSFHSWFVYAVFFLSHSFSLCAWGLSFEGNKSIHSLFTFFLFQAWLFFVVRYNTRSLFAFLQCTCIFFFTSDSLCCFFSIAQYFRIFH